jgi:uncharacterized protein YneR
MKLQVTPEAAKWFMEEMDLAAGEAIRFYIQLYGSSGTEHHNYSLGIMRDTPSADATVRTEVGGIMFFFAESDKWFLDDYEMSVTIENDEPKYTFQLQSGK